MLQSKRGFVKQEIGLQGTEDAPVDPDRLHSAQADVKRMRRLPIVKIGLMERLLILTVAFVLVAEFLIFLPSITKFRSDWFAERVQAAEIAATALEIAPDRKVSQELSARLLNETQLLAVAMGDEEMWEQVFSPPMPIASMPVTMDLRDESWFDAFFCLFAHATAKDGRILQVISHTDSGTEDSYIDIIVPEEALRSDLLEYSINILLISLLISAIVGSFIAWSLYHLVVKPMMKITNAVADFGEAPERLAAFKPSGRDDEIGKAELALVDMQSAVSNSFRQNKRLAELGEAVAKISHDLRNSLSVARLASDSLMRSEDPRVQSAAPRLERAIERAIGLAEATLQYGKADAPKAHMVTVELRNIAEDALLEGVAANPEVDWLNDVDEEVQVYADPEMLHRLLANLVRNAGQAIAQQEADAEPGLIRIGAEIIDDTWIQILVEDNGPGVPEKVKTKIFQPFSTSENKGGSGLGLAITRELALAMGGEVALDETVEKGAVFKLKLQLAGVSSGEISS